MKRISLFSAISMCLLWSACNKPPIPVEPTPTIFVEPSAVPSPSPSPTAIVVSNKMEEMMKHMIFEEEYAKAEETRMVLTEEEEKYLAECDASLTAYLTAEPIMYDLVGYVTKQVPPPVEKINSVMLIPELLFSSTSTEVKTYCTAVQNDTGDFIWVLTPKACNASPEAVRASIKYLYDTYKIEGVILVGQWRLAAWKCTQPNGYVRSGPLFTFYETLDKDDFSRDESDPAIQGLKSTYNRFNRKCDYIHDNTFLKTGDKFCYGPEVWIVMWRATEVHYPLLETERSKEIEQVSKFIKKAVQYHTKNNPYWEPTTGTSPLFLPRIALGICHDDYVGNCDISKPGTVAKYLYGLLGKGYWYDEGADFINKFMSNKVKVGIFDVWTHASPTVWCPGHGNPCISASSMFKSPDPEAGLFLTPIFGCSSGNIINTEQYGRVNYALSLLFGNSIGLSSVGTPWGIGFEGFYKLTTYKALLEQEATMGQSYYIDTTQMFYETQLPDPYEKWGGEYKVKAYLYFGDPYAQLPILDAVSKIE